MRKSITTLVFFLASIISFGAAAQAPSAPLTLRPDAPDRYVVVPGDTLWSISQRYTDSPWRWPELWGMNRDEIRNPHLIYPGYVIILDRARGTLSLGDRATGATPGKPSASAEPGSVRLTPRARAESLAREQIPSIAPAIIEPFLSRPLVIEPDGLDKAPTIVGTETDRVILGPGHNAYVRGIGGSKEEQWYVYRRGGPLIDPDTNQTLAYEAIYLGTAQVSRPGEPATVRLTSAVREIEAGDKLVAAGRPQPINYSPHAADKAMRGRVIAIHGGLGKVGEAGPQTIISINRGAKDGLETGHVLAIYNQGGSVRDYSRAADAKDRNIQLPDERAGLAFVFRVFERVSYALVMNITRPVAALDVVRAP